MPRETIRSSVTDEPFEVKVGWERDRDVQVGVEVTDDRSLFWQLLDGYAGQIGAEVRRIVAEVDAEQTQPGPHNDPNIVVGEALLNLLDASPGLAYRGLWTTLDRGGSNDLIRVLRRARNSAFGTDE